MGILTKAQLRELIRENKIKTTEDIDDLLKNMFSDLIQETSEAELDTELGYPKNGSIPEGSGNRRNGHTKKTVRSGRGKIELSVPRDRSGDFEPVIIKKHQREVSGIEEQILALYGKGVSVREIQDHLNRMYGVDVSPTLISNEPTASCRLSKNGSRGRCKEPMPSCFWMPFITKSSKKDTLSTRRSTW